MEIINKEVNIMSMIEFPLKIVIKFIKPTNDKKKEEIITEILSFLDVHNLLPKWINLNLYSASEYLVQQRKKQNQKS